MGRTASDLRREGWPEEEMGKYRPWASIRRYGKDKDVASRRERALEIARKAAGLLKERFGAIRVMLFGSLAHGAWFTPRSDIDLLVEGVSPQAFFRAEAAVEALASGFKVDLVDPKECSPELLSRIGEEGLEL
jgi:predicted nucleotidyltransferase